MCGTANCGCDHPSRDLTPGAQGIIRAGHFAVTPDKHIVGIANGPTELPTHRIVDGGDVLGYEQLFSELTPEGNAMLYRNPGTFGQLHAVGRRI